MYYRDHNPPHIHAIYGEYEATVTIDSGMLLAGTLPSRALAMVREWLTVNRNDIAANWERARQQLPLEQIVPLP